ncbi:GNAT family N-acetyltransferase [Millisia brevis]|uniref:GNAT family N-acetyltransferase n=1 Tax=Millisia brevis TaxID=264148 RepID=UPI0008341575|nr:GNAT family N-acetyltransferase [Millisia brevis]
MSSGVGEILAVDVRQGDRVLVPMFEDLAREYGGRYNHPPAQVLEDLYRYDATRFSATGGGGFVALLRDDEVVAGGAWQRYDESTAELKRIWTSPAARGERLGVRVVAELETRIAAAGYSGVYLTTGWHQPEAVRLYVRTGYTPQFDVAAYPVGRQPHPFRKQLG